MPATPPLRRKENFPPVNTQLVIVLLILAAAIGYAARRIYDTFRHANDPCNGCEMKKNCQKFCQYKEM